MSSTEDNVKKSILGENEVKFGRPAAEQAGPQQSPEGQAPPAEFTSAEDEGLINLINGTMKQATALILKDEGDGKITEEEFESFALGSSWLAVIKHYIGEIEWWNPVYTALINTGRWGIAVILRKSKKPKQDKKPPERKVPDVGFTTDSATLEAIANRAKKSQ